MKFIICLIIFVALAAFNKAFEMESEYRNDKYNHLSSEPGNTVEWNGYEM